MLPKTKLYRTGDLMAGMQYLIIFMAPVMVCNYFGAEGIGFILGFIFTILMYLVNRQSNEGAIKHYVTYCFTPNYLEGNTDPSEPASPGNNS